MRHGFATAAAGVLAFSGGAVLVYALSQQEESAPQPELSTSASLTPTATVTASGRAAPQPSASRRARGPASRATASKVVGPVLAPSNPVSLAIPAIGVQSPLLHLGLTAKGSLEVPVPGPDYDKAAWYRNSPAPGALGPAILLGHIDSETDGPSVFFKLGSLRPRDTVTVTRADGSVAVFAVDDVRRFRKKDFPTQLVYGNTNHAALRIITCGGPFDSESRSYRDNIIVMASLVR